MRDATSTGGPSLIRRVALTAAAVAVLSMAATAGAHPRKHSPQYRAAVRCNHGHVTACILRASLRFGVPYPLMRAIAWCESRLDPGAANPSGSTGLYEFMPGTFAGTPYGRHSIWSAKWSALAAGWEIRRYGTGAWDASRPCWG